MCAEHGDDVKKYRTDHSESYRMLQRRLSHMYVLDAEPKTPPTLPLQDSLL